MEQMSKSLVGSRDQINSVKQKKFQMKGRGCDPKKGGQNIKSQGPKAELRSVVETRHYRQVARRGSFLKIRRKPIKQQKRSLEKEMVIHLLLEEG